jgi:hypothetical protein
MKRGNTIHQMMGLEDPHQRVITTTTTSSPSNSTSSSSSISQGFLQQQGQQLQHLLLFNQVGRCFLTLLVLLTALIPSMINLQEVIIISLSSSRRRSLRSARVFKISWVLSSLTCLP